MLPNIELQRLNGTKEQSLDYAGKLLLVVNVASECGFTSQYKDLQSLYEEFHAQGLEILAFPCNQFGGQEPGTPEQIEQFCSTKYGVTFPIFQKTDVNGPDAHPLFEYDEAWIIAVNTHVLGNLLEDGDAYLHAIGLGLFFFDGWHSCLI